MQTITLEINDKEALKKIQLLEDKKLITIVREVTLDTPALAGKPMSTNAFREWINLSEQSGKVSLQEAINTN